MDLFSIEKQEEPVVETLGGRLNNLNIEDKRVQEEHNGWKSAENVENLKAKFKDLTQEAKQEAKDGNLVESLKLYKKAYKIHKSEKVASRIAKIEAMLESESEESAEEDGFVKMAKGFQLSEKVHNKLYPYQREGVLWFWKLYVEQKGGILGDDMGLGKTIQVISFLSGMFASGHIKSVIVIMPVSLLTNWEKEFKLWAPEIRVRNFHGSSVKQRRDNLAKIQSRNGVLLTTYGLANTCSGLFSEDRHQRTFTWDYIILDEGHKIKNTAIKTAIAIRAIPARNHFILTGTPIQNNLREMWALFDYVTQGKLLGTSRSFKQEYENPIVRARERDATAYEKRIGQEMSAHLRELIEPYFLRRSKAILENYKETRTGDKVDGPEDGDVSSDKENEANKGEKTAKLTRKNDFIIWLYLSPTQLQIYEDFGKLDRVKEILMTKKSPLAELNVLKKICDHPRLLSTMACRQLGLSDELDDTEEDTDAKYQWCAPPVEQLVQESGKLVFLVRLLIQLKSEGHRTLVFSHSRKMIDIIEKVLKEKNMKLSRLDGTITSIVERESRIDKFQRDPSISVFLLTTQVGGVGLTLTAADRVVIFDPSWNPATDAQAVDRAYRIGQKNTVVIYRLITCGSIEEKIYRKQVFKQAITKQTTGSSDNPYRYFARHELRDLFVLEDHRKSDTQIQLEKMHSAHRVTDTTLDEHVAFLYSTDIFGISDHDLLFTKEAIATEEELSAASEMSDIIQAKVRRAADIMRAESNQASIALRSMPAPPVKTTQPNIHDHVEVFIPSKEDSKRFKPKKSKSPTNPCFVDLTELDKRVDDDDLEQRFSAIRLDDGRALNNTRGESKTTVVVEANVRGDNDFKRITSRDNDVPCDVQVTGMRNEFVKNIVQPQTNEIEKKTVEQDWKDVCHESNDLFDQVEEKDSIDKGVELQYNKDDMGTDEVDSKDVNNDFDSMFDAMQESDPEMAHNENDLGSDEVVLEVRGSDRQSDQRSDNELFERIEPHVELPESPPMIEVSEKSPGKLFKKLKADNSDDEEIVRNIVEDSENEDDLSGKPSCTIILSSSDEEEISRIPRKTSSKRTLGSESEDDSNSLHGCNDESGLEGKSIGSEAKVKDVGKDELSVNVNHVSSAQNLIINSDSDNEEMFSNPENREVEVIPNTDESSSENDEISINSMDAEDEPKEATLIFAESEEPDDDVVDDVENGDAGCNDVEEDGNDEDDDVDDDAENSDVGDDVEIDDVSCDVGEDLNDNVGDDADDSVSDGVYDDVDDDEDDDKISSRNISESESISGKSSFDENSEQSSRKTSDSENERTEQQSDEEEELQSSKYTTCCPQGVHVSKTFTVRKCPCLMSATNIEAYKMHISTARRHWKSGEVKLCLKHFTYAFKLCDSDERLRIKIKECYEMLKK